MKIYLFLTDRIVSFTLPKKMFGSYAFDANLEEELHQRIDLVKEENGKTKV